jgi:hypothetical protein
MPFLLWYTGTHTEEAIELAEAGFSIRTMKGLRG